MTCINNEWCFLKMKGSVLFVKGIFIDLNVYWGFLRDLRVERSILLTFFVRMLQQYFFEK